MESFIYSWITVGFILTKLYALFYQVNPESAFDREIANEYLFNKPLYESKIKFFTKKYANPMSSYYYRNPKYLINDWDFSYDLIPYIRHKENNSEIYNKYDGNEQYIALNFFINGSRHIEQEIQCQLKEKIRDVVNRFLSKCSYKFKNEPLFIYNNRKLNLDKQVGYLFNNLSWVEVIDISDLKFIQ